MSSYTYPGIEWSISVMTHHSYAIVQDIPQPRRMGRTPVKIQVVEEYSFLETPSVLMHSGSSTLFLIPAIFEILAGLFKSHHPLVRSSATASFPTPSSTNVEGSLAPFT